MRQFIYSRVSTEKQTTTNQSDNLQLLYPDALIISETASGAKRRPELERLLSSLVRGDELIVMALDRLGRSASQVINLIEDLDRRGVNLISIREGVNYKTIAGRLVTQILCSVAEMERAIISERIVSALTAKKAQGIVLGRKTTYPKELTDEAIRLYETGLSIREVAKVTGISRSRVGQLVAA